MKKIWPNTPTTREHTDLVCVQTTCSHTAKLLLTGCCGQVDLPVDIQRCFSYMVHAEHYFSITDCLVLAKCLLTKGKSSSILSRQRYSDRSVFLWCERTWPLVQERTEEKMHCQALAAPLSHTCTLPTNTFIQENTKTKKRRSYKTLGEGYSV